MDNNLKTILVCGAGGFIGSHLVKRLKEQGHFVVGADLKMPEWSESPADDFYLGDLTDIEHCMNIFNDYAFDEVYQLAADMGGAGYVFTGEHDADILNNSAQINLNIAKLSTINGCKVFYSSSACVYRDLDTNESNTNPDSDYGLEKLFSEHVYQAYHKNYGLNMRIARFHNIFGPEGTYKGGKEKSPAAICRKVINADTEIEMWGDGEQTRSFLYIDECLDGVQKLMESEFLGPVNIGSDEMVTINQLAEMAMEFKGKKLDIRHIDGPLGVRGRTSDNTLIQKELNWKPTQPLKVGLEKTYRWIEAQELQ